MYLFYFSKMNVPQPKKTNNTPSQPPAPVVKQTPAPTPSIPPAPSFSKTISKTT